MLPVISFHFYFPGLLCLPAPISMAPPRRILRVGIETYNTILIVGSAGTTDSRHLALWAHIFCLIQSPSKEATCSRLRELTSIFSSFRHECLISRGEGCGATTVKPQAAMMTVTHCICLHTVHTHAYCMHRWGSAFGSWVLGPASALSAEIRA